MPEQDSSDNKQRPTATPEQQALKSTDAHEIVNANAARLSSVEQKRTNASDGSLRDRQRRIEEQDESIQIEGLGAKADRKTRLTEKDLLKAEAAAKLEGQPQSDKVKLADPLDGRPIIELTPEQLNKKTFSLAVEYQEGRTPSQMIADFSRAAIRRLTDPTEQKAYFQAQIDKVCGIYAGLDIAKEDTKKAAVVAWTVLTDGTVANFLKHKDAINEPLFRTIGSTLDVMARDPHAVDHALNHLGREIIKANDWYNSLPPHEQGKVIGKAMFALVNPEGSTAAGESALTITKSFTAPMRQAVTEQVEMLAARSFELSATAPEKAYQLKQLLQESVRSLRLSPVEMEAAGIPRGYFDGMPPVKQARMPEQNFAMSKADDLGNELPKVDSAFRGDHDPYSPLHPKGWRKSHITESGDLTPANPAGEWNGKEVTVGHHLDGGWNTAMKGNSPFTSFSANDGVIAKYGGGNGIILRVLALKEAILLDKLQGVKIIELAELLEQIENSNLSKMAKTKHRAWAIRDNEVLVRGVIPAEFITVVKN